MAPLEPSFINGVVLNVQPDGITSKNGCPMAKTSWLSRLLRASALLAVALLFAAGSTKADKITMFDAASNYPIGVVGLALCPTPAACNQGLSHAIASFYFSPQPTGGEFTIGSSSPAFAAIAGFLSMTEQQILQTALNEAIVPFFWNSGPDPGTGGFYTASNPNVNFYAGHFDQHLCVINGVEQVCGYPLAGREIDSLSIAVSPAGEMTWSAEGVHLVPEVSAAFDFAFSLPLLFLFARWRKNRE